MYHAAHRLQYDPNWYLRRGPRKQPSSARPHDTLPCLCLLIRTGRLRRLLQARRIPPYLPDGVIKRFFEFEKCAVIPNSHTGKLSEKVDLGLDRLSIGIAKGRRPLRDGIIPFLP